MSDPQSDPQSEGASDRTAQKIVVVGGGTMGNGIVHTFAVCGYPVTLI